MKTAKEVPHNFLTKRIIAFSVLLSMLALGCLDRFTPALDNLQSEEVLVLLIYSVPALIICSFIFEIFIRKNTLTKKMALSVLIGVPLSFLCMTLLLGFLY